MSSKFSQTSKYLFYALYTNVAFGFIYYLVFMWLVGYSLFYAYLGSLALIVIGLKLDGYLVKSLESTRIVTELERMKEQHREKNYRVYQWVLDSFISFKTILFVFYFLILVVSQIINIDPSLVGEDLSKFVLANSYCIVLLIAFDRIVAQFSKDRTEMKTRSERLQVALSEKRVVDSSFLPLE